MKEDRRVLFGMNERMGVVGTVEHCSSWLLDQMARLASTKGEMEENSTGAQLTPAGDTEGKDASALEF